MSRLYSFEGSLLENTSHLKYEHLKPASSDVATPPGPGCVATSNPCKMQHITQRNNLSTTASHPLWHADAANPVDHAVDLCVCGGCGGGYLRVRRRAKGLLGAVGPGILLCRAGTAVSARAALARRLRSSSAWPVITALFPKGTRSHLAYLSPHTPSFRASAPSASHAGASKLDHTRRSYTHDRYTPDGHEQDVQTHSGRSRSS